MHHIRRHTFEIQFSSQEKAFDLQTRFTELMHDALLPVIEEVFTQVSLPNVIIRLDTLDINLGEITLDSLEHDLPDILRNKLTDALLAAIGEIRYFPQENNQLITKEKADTEVLIHFLQNGTLPWWSSHPRQADFSLAALLEQCMHTQPRLLIASLQQEMKAPEVRIRLTRQFPDEVLFQLLSQLIPACLPFVKVLITGLIQTRQAGKGLPFPPAAFRETLWDFVWTYVFLQNRLSFEEKQLAEELFTHISTQASLPLSQVLWHIVVPTKTGRSISTEQKAVQALAQRIMAEKRLRELDIFTGLWQTATSQASLQTQTVAERFTALIRAIEPAQANSIEKLVRLLTRIFLRATTGTATNLQKVDEVIREAFIQHLFTERRTAFDMPVFLKKSIPLIVNRLAVPMEQVEKVLAEAGSEVQPIAQAIWQVIQENPQAFTSFRETTLANKPSENATAYARLLLEGRIKPPVRYTDLDILRFFLQFGVIPWTERIRTSPDLIHQIVTDQMAAQPAAFRQWFTSSGLIRQPEVVQRIQSQFAPEVANWLLEGIAPAAPAGNQVLSMAALTAREDVLVHYLSVYVETGYLPAEVPLPMAELLRVFINTFPETCRAFVFTLPEDKQQILLDHSPELAAFLAGDHLSAGSSIPDSLEAAEPESKENHTETRQTYPDEENLSIDTARPVENSSVLSEKPVNDSGEIPFPEETYQRTAGETVETKEKPLHIMRENVADTSTQNPEQTPFSSTSEANISAPVPPETRLNLTENSPPLQEADHTNRNTAPETQENTPDEPVSAQYTEEADTEDSVKPTSQPKEETIIEFLLPENEHISHSDPESLPAEETDVPSNTFTPESSTAQDQAGKPPVEKEKQTILPPKNIKEEETPSSQILPGKTPTADQKPLSRKPVPIPKPVSGSSKRYVWRQPEEPLYIRNAGLVLIHPFLSRFFTMLKLTANKKFIDEQAAQRGVHLLHYISHKSEGAPEYELALNKILCGLPVAMPLEKEVVLTEEEKDICESLIKGVIGNWPILKNTSPDNFRVSFLHREGRLIYTSEDWQLKVENRGYDMLIDKLPWAYSIIKLPWMEKVVRVEWR